MGRSGTTVLLLSVLLLVGITNTVGADETYLLGPGDRLQISVFGRPDLSRPATISPSGTISMPLIGQVPVAGLDSMSAEERISAAYERNQATDTSVAPRFSVNLEILQYRPFYVLGDVERAGSYPYQSGLTVLHAIAIAGGRLSTRNATRFSPVDYSREEETLTALLDTYLTDVVREARLVSEQGSLAVMQLPEDVATQLSDARVQEAVAAEIELFRTRAGVVDGQVVLLSARIDEYDKEISELSDEREALRRKRDLIEQRVAAFRDLVQQGVGARMDLLQLEINSIEAEREIRQNSVLILNSTLGRNQAEQGVSNLRTQRLQSIASDLVAVRTSLSHTLIRIEKSAERLELMRGATDGVDARPDEARYMIRRLHGDSRTEIPAGPDIPVRPSDTVIVPFPPKQDVTGRSVWLPRRLQD